MVNPAVSVSMWSLGKCSYTECFVRIAGQMGGGLVAFPLFNEISTFFNLTPFGGPEFSQENDAEAFLSEFCATFLLMWAIYLVRMRGTHFMLERPAVVVNNASDLVLLSLSYSIYTPTSVLSSDYTAQLGNPFWQLPLHYQADIDRCCHSSLD